MFYQKMTSILLLTKFANYLVAGSVWLSVAAFSSFLAADESNESSSLNRLILEVQHTSYTQRQAEVYYLIKAAIQEGRSIQILEESWRNIRIEFKNDMVIDQESNRLGSFRPNPRQLKQSMDLLRDRIAIDRDLAKDFERLGADAQEMEQALLSIFRVEAFKRSKVRGASVMTGTESFRSTDDFSDKDWFIKIEQESAVRWYEGVEKWMPYRPFLSQKSGK